MQQSPNVDNSENSLIYSLSPPFADSASTELLSSVFPGSSTLLHSRTISSDPDSMLAFVRRTHPSLDQYKTNIMRPLVQGSENSEQRNVTPPSPRRTQKLPASRRLSRSHPYSDGEEEALERPPPEDATEQEKANWRRRQNTLAARKSRKRKQDQIQQLHEDVQRLSREKDVWRERALMLKQLLRSHGLPTPTFDCWNFDYNRYQGQAPATVLVDSGVLPLRHVIFLVSFFIIFNVCWASLISFKFLGSVSFLSTLWQWLIVIYTPATVALSI